MHSTLRPYQGTRVLEYSTRVPVLGVLEYPGISLYWDCLSPALRAVIAPRSLLVSFAKDLDIIDKRARAYARVLHVSRLLAKYNYDEYQDLSVIVLRACGGRIRTMEGVLRPIREVHGIAPGLGRTASTPMAHGIRC